MTIENDSIEMIEPSSLVEVVRSPALTQADLIEARRAPIKIDGLEILNIPAEEYHLWPAVGHSALVELMRSPAHFRNYMDSPRVPTASMEFGTALHAAVLEPHLFLDAYIECPKFDRRTKAGKEAALEWEEKNKGKIGLEPAQMESIKALQRSVAAHVRANELLARGYAELSVFWTDPETGIACKCRPDFLVLDDNGDVDCILDIKSTVDGSRDAFAKSIANYGYDLQAGFYTEPFRLFLGKELPFRFLALESEAPNAAALYRAGPVTMKVGRKKFRGALQLLEWCGQNQSWPGYQPFGDEEVIEVPSWAAKFHLAGDDD